MICKIIGLQGLFLFVGEYIDYNKTKFIVVKCCEYGNIIYGPGSESEAIHIEPSRVQSFIKAKEKEVDLDKVIRTELHVPGK